MPLPMLCPLVYSPSSVCTQRRRCYAHAQRLTLVRNGSTAWLLCTCSTVGRPRPGQTGTLTACERGMDVMGCIIMACVTSMGGGTLRDILLAHDENGARPLAPRARARQPVCNHCQEGLRADAGTACNQTGSLARCGWHAVGMPFACGWHAGGQVRVVSC